MITCRPNHTKNSVRAAQRGLLGKDAAGLFKDHIPWARYWVISPMPPVPVKNSRRSLGYVAHEGIDEITTQSAKNRAKGSRSSMGQSIHAANDRKINERKIITEAQ